MDMTNNSKTVWVAVLAALSAVLVGAAAQAADAVPEVVPEQWTQNFRAALDLAWEKKAPLLVYGSSKGCPYCKRMQAALDSDAFKTWIKGTGIYLVDTHYHLTNSVPQQAQAARFIAGLTQNLKSVYPLMGVYWPKSSNEAVRAAFTCRRGEMPGERSPLLVGEFVNAMDSLLGDYLKTRGPRPKLVIEPMLVGRDGPKFVRAAREGEGSVVMSPASGELYRGKLVRLTARPAPGMVLKGWRYPDGKLWKNARSNSLTVRFSMDDGVYTAVFVKK